MGVINMWWDIAGFVIICVVGLALFVGFLMSETEKDNKYKQEIEYGDDYGKWR
jgi:putative Mn2+ efflux pump MntP